MSDSYSVFSDESRYRASRFRSIAAISLPTNQIPDVQKELNDILTTSDVREFKWKKVRSARARFCAVKLIDYFIDHLIPHRARLDAVIWDTRDNRHNIYGRDDTKNLERMYFHLHKNLMTRREAEAEWHLRPDEQVELDWETLEECLSSVGRWHRHLSTLFPEDPDRVQLFHVNSLKQVQSHEYPLCQLADLFAGIGPYTRSCRDKMRMLLDQATGQLPLFELEKTVQPGPTDIIRFEVVQYLHNRCQQMKLGVSFESYAYLLTRNPNNPINFWHYLPQHPEDKAPTKSD